MTHAAPTTGDLEGKVALITGSARNLGRAIAEGLAVRGADIVLHHHGDSSADQAREAAASIEKLGRRALVTSGDLAQSATVAAMFEAAKDAFGRIDIVINNAGMVLKKPIADVTDDEFDRSFGVNAKAAFFVLREASQSIEDDGRIISMGTSLLGATTGLYGLYAGSKAPLEDFTRALAKEIGHRGVTVNVIAPGPLDTPFFHGEENEQSVAYLKAASVHNRLGEISDIIPVINFVTSQGAGWLTAQTVFVNGGFVSR